jgi:hypothetical protein
MISHRDDSLAHIHEQLAHQDQQWAEAKTQILALGDVELSLTPEAIADLESAGTPTFTGSLPMGLTRA